MAVLLEMASIQELAMQARCQWASPAPILQRLDFMSRQQGQIHIGTSGWMYRDWRGVLYPRRLPARRWLAFYTTAFQTVEINNTFYHLPTEQTFLAWRRQAPPGFIFAVKANRYLTHQKKLKQAEEPLDVFLGRALLLQASLGPILYQLTPYWRCDRARLASFLALLPRDLKHVFEFREDSWYQEDIRTLLTQAGVGLCIHDSRRTACPHWLTSPLVYVRFHGPTDAALAGRYDWAHLRRWAKCLDDFRKAGHDVWAYFNNDMAGNAVINARELSDLLGVEPPSNAAELLFPATETDG
jgi:uncharacterized protein YecE (DUF72 family)